MTINFKGAEKGMDYRLAEITFGESELHRMERIQKILEIRGWDVDIVTDMYAQCEVDDRMTYREFVKDYKEAKRCIIACERYGF